MSVFLKAPESALMLACGIACVRKRTVYRVRDAGVATNPHPRAENFPSRFYLSIGCESLLLNFAATQLQCCASGA
jgi:hypothetical protein